MHLPILRVGFSKILGKPVVYAPTYTKGTLKKKKKKKKKKSAKDLSNDACAMFLYIFFSFLIFFQKAYVVGTHLNCNSNGYPQHMPL